MHQMRLAQPHAAVQKQWIESWARRLLRDTPGARMRHFVRLADDKRLERETRVERAGDVNSGFRFFLDVHSGFRVFVNRLRGHPDYRTSGIAYHEIDPAHRRILGLPQRCHTRAMTIAHPIAPKSGRQRNGDLIAVDPRESHWP